ncbi:MAG: acyl-CoA thioesterase [Bacteroidia bacterium]|nr:acyl-CoA thioesterase [Bacteroidia bacterium]
MKSYKSISESEIIYSELMVPHYANFGGKVHGGRVLLIMDNVAFTVATKHASSYCVTASVEGVDFLAPVEVGTLLVIKSRVNYTGNTSMIIGMRVETHNPITGKIIHTNSSYFTMVSIDQESKKPKKTPGVLISDEEDLRRFCEGIQIKKSSIEKRNILKSDLSGFSQKELHQMVKNENCKMQG